MAQMHSNLDVTLRSGRLVDDWLAAWVLRAAQMPASVSLEVTQSLGGSHVVELQDENGIAAGGIILVTPSGSVHVHPAIDPANDPFTKRRSIQEMTCALEEAVGRERRLRLYERAAEVILYGVIPLAVITAIPWILKWVL